MPLFSSKPNISKMQAKLDIAGLIKALNYTEKEVREKAAFALLDIVDPNESKEHVEKMTRVIALLAFHPKRPQDFETLLESLTISAGDRSEIVRWGAGRVLAYLVLCGKRDSRIVDILIPALNDPDTQVCIEAARGLTFSEDRRAVNPLIAARIVHQVSNEDGHDKNITYLVKTINGALDSLGGVVKD